MNIKLEFKKETSKAFQLPNGYWIPKSVLDGRGLEHPYYHIHDWWLSIQVENITCSVDKLKYIRKKFDEKEKDISLNVLYGLKPMVIKHTDIPKEIRDKHTAYWKCMSSDLGSYTPDYEPRIWGNDCFDGDPHLHGQN